MEVKKKLKNNTYKLLFKISGVEKLSEMDELEMVPVNVFFPRSVAIFHLKQKLRVKWFKVAKYNDSASSRREVKYSIGSSQEKYRSYL